MLPFVRAFWLSCIAPVHTDAPKYGKSLLASRFLIPLVAWVRKGVLELAAQNRDLGFVLEFV
jgi:hypothetical protein